MCYQRQVLGHVARKNPITDRKFLDHEEFICRFGVESRESMHPDSWGAGRSRGHCTKETIGSLCYMKGDKHSPREIRFPREQIVFLEFRLALPTHQAGRFSDCIWFSWEMSWHREAGFLLCYGGARILLC